MNMIENSYKVRVLNPSNGSCTRVLIINNNIISEYSFELPNEFIPIDLLKIGSEFIVKKLSLVVSDDDDISEIRKYNNYYEVVRT